MSEDPGFALEDVGIAERDKPPFVRLPKPENLFGLRAMRFAALAPGHQLEAYLLFLSALSKVQDKLARELPPPALPSQAQMRQRAGHAMPILPREELADDPAASEAFAHLVTQLADVAMPDLARAALDRAGQADDEGRRAMLAAVLADAVPVEAVAEHIFAAAALQIVAAQRAAQLDPVLPQPVADGVCPCCGGPPVSSTVAGDANIEGVRYVQCSLCATQWNHVRVKCVSCGSTKGIAYQAIEGIADTIKAETCDECRTYVKILNQRKDMELEPVADDVASLSLDLLVTEAGWRRAGVNPFLLGY
ncbi:formate dehydrogenase accessory protein FdhE [Bosea sp. RAF48]|uniref:formate dehydrogenase accessory protein FdhE n=1 Tax=Bosea sp. RAF48 TaxID=3237480 RepID=UPI003F919DDC